MDSWTKYDNTIWIDDPLNNDPDNHILSIDNNNRPSTHSSTRSSSPESLSSVSSTVPVGDDEVQSVNPPLPPPPTSENYRGTDGLWRIPNGEWHPRNLTHIYDTNGRLREVGMPRDNYKGPDGLWHYPAGQLNPRNIYVTDGPIVNDNTDNDSFAE